MSQDPGAVTTSEQLGEASDFSIRPMVINYASDTFIGVPQFSYKDAELDLKFSGDDITRGTSPWARSSRSRWTTQSPSMAPFGPFRSWCRRSGCAWATRSPSTP
jgi:hypothetical protein